MRPVIKMIRRYSLLALIVSGLAFAAAYLSSEVKRVDHPLHFSAEYLALALVLHAIYWFALSALWRRVVAEVTECRISLKESFYQLCLVSIGKYLPGKVWGMFARGSYMRQRNGITPAGIINATYVEQFLLLYSAFLLIALLLVVLYGTFWTWMLMAAAIAGAIVGQRFNGTIVGLIARLYGWLGGKDRQEAAIGNLGPGTYYVLLLSYVVIWLLLGLVFAGVYFTFFSAPITRRTVYSMMLANTVGNTAGFLAIFAPGGIGVREAVSSGLLASQISLANAVLLSVLFRLWLVATEIGLGMVAIIGSGRDLVTLMRNANPAGDD